MLSQKRHIPSYKCANLNEHAEQITNLERIIYMPDILSGRGVVTTQHLWTGYYQFQFVLVEPRHTLQKGSQLHSQVY
jgi:hypothetical protein